MIHHGKHFSGRGHFGDNGQFRVLVRSSNLTSNASVGSVTGLPPPTISIVNPTNGHCHLFWELEDAVCFSKNGRKKAKDYFSYIRNSFCVKAGGDLDYIGLLAKTPFHAHWITYCFDRMYSLDELNEYVPASLSLKSFQRLKKRHRNPEHRNSTIASIVVRKDRTIPRNPHEH